ncbi:unnamed protein product [marine sediment metagenome]|uniref:Uncharacterized protein n=1 Tax=marine sediment metagenome TaxID=412755 RepID=X0SNZ6_9ZZZZ
MKLFRVTCRGMVNVAGNVAYGVAYVVAKDAGAAYRKLRSYLDEKDLGFDGDRELSMIELLAEDVEYPDCGTCLYL